MRTNRPHEEDRTRMYQYPEGWLGAEEFECQLPPDALAELTATPGEVQPRREPEPSQPSVQQAAPGPGPVISSQKGKLATLWLVVVLLAVILTATVTTALNHSGGAGRQVLNERTGSRDTTIVASRPVTVQPPQQPAQLEVRRALPVDTVEVRRAELVVPRAELVRLPSE
jgi:hypothetical protein